VGGLDLTLGVAVAVNIANAKAWTADSRSSYDPYPADGVTDLKVTVMRGFMSLVCLNVVSVPLCLVGVGLAIVGLVAHGDRNHLFSWIGLFGNGAVLVGVLGLLLLGLDKSLLPAGLAVVGVLGVLLLGVIIGLLVLRLRQVDQVVPNRRN
jgi:hypothetical protein